MTAIGLEATVRRSEGAIASDIDGEVVMMNMENGAYYTMNGIGSRIWQLIEEPFQVCRLVDSLVREFDVDRPTCETETLNFLRELQKEEVVLVGHF